MRMARRIVAGAFVVVCLFYGQDATQAISQVSCNYVRCEGHYTSVYHCTFDNSNLNPNWDPYYYQDCSQAQYIGWGWVPSAEDEAAQQCYITDNVAIMANFSCSNGPASGSFDCLVTNSENACDD